MQNSCCESNEYDGLWVYYSRENVMFTNNNTRPFESSIIYYYLYAVSIFQSRMAPNPTLR
jgi:hypothetical protein